MTEEKAVAVIVLWKTLRFSTWDIANLLGETEALVAHVLHIWREAKRGVVAA